MKGRARRIFLIVAGILTLALGIVAVIIGIRISQDQAPEDSSANACGTWCSNPKSQGGQCPVGVLAGGCNGTWQVRDNSSACGTTKECYVSPLNAPSPIPSSLGCTISVPTTTGPITIANCSSGQSFQLHVKNVARGTTDSQCIPTIVSNPQIIQLENGTYDPRNFGSGCGKCVQLDSVENKGGSAQYSGDCPVTETVQCHKCTDSLNDANTCTAAQTFEGTSCPAGYVATSSECRLSEASGQCAVQKTCYKCSDATNDGNTCESFTANSSTCPSGTSETANGCATAAGGSCENVITCYRCTDASNDGNNCEPLVVTGLSCPSGTSTTANGCATAVGGFCNASVACNGTCDGVSLLCTGVGQICFNGKCRLQSNTSSEQCLPQGATPTPSGLPDTALFDEEGSGIMLLGFLFLIVGIIEYRYQLFAHKISDFVLGLTNATSFYKIKIKEIPKITSQIRDNKLLKKSEKRFKRKLEK